MKGSAVLQMLRGKDVILNPGSDYGKLFPPQEIEAMLDGSIFGSKKLDVGGQKILLGQPKEYPHRLVDSLSRFLEKQRDARAAYLAHALMPDVDTAPHTLIGIETDGDWQKLLKDLTAVAQEATSPGAFTDFIQLKPNATDVIREYMHNNTKPFYARKKWLGLF